MTAERPQILALYARMQHKRSTSGEALRRQRRRPVEGPTVRGSVLISRWVKKERTCYGDPEKK